MGNSSSAPPPDPYAKITEEEKAKYLAEEEKCKATVSSQRAALEKQREEEEARKQAAIEAERQHAIDVAAGKSVEDALNDANLIETLNRLAAQITCDSDCQHQKRLEALRDRFNYWTRTLRQAPDQVTKSEKAYVVFDKGEEAYDAMIFKRNEVKAQEFKNKSSAMHSQVDNAVQLLTRQYGFDTIFAKRVQELLLLKMEDYVKIKQSQTQFDQQRNTDGRRVAYEDKSMVTLHFFNKTILFLYYGMLVVYIVFGSFVSKQQYENKAMWIILINYILFPLVVYWLTVKMFGVKNDVQHMLRDIPYKNVYRDL